VLLMFKLCLLYYQNKSATVSDCHVCKSVVYSVRRNGLCRAHLTLAPWQAQAGMRGSERTLDTILLAGGWNLLEQDALPILLECEQQGKTEYQV
jgi:hypothetical protein